jgi:hypothetical protein
MMGSIVKLERPARQASTRDRRRMAKGDRESFVAPEGWLDAIRKEMALAGISDADLARLMDVKQPQVHKLFAGKGGRSLAQRVGDHFSLPVLFWVESKDEARAMGIIKTLSAKRLAGVVKLLENLVEVDGSDEPSTSPPEPRPANRG